MHIPMKRKAAVGFVLSAALAVMLFPVSASAVTAAQKQSEIQSVSAQLDSLNYELSLAVDDYRPIATMIVPLPKLTSASSALTRPRQRSTRCRRVSRRAPRRCTVRAP